MILAAGVPALTYWGRVVLVIFRYFCAFVFIVSVVNVLKNITAYYEDKRKKVVREAERMVTSLGTKIDVTNELMKLIDDLIMIEFGSLLHRFAIMNQQYPVNRTDNDVKAVATTVFEAIKGEYFTDDDLILTEDYLFRYITERSKTLILASVMEYNQGSAQLPDNGEE